MLTTRQASYYWSLWKQWLEAHPEAAGETSAQRDARRRELHKRAKCRPSMRDFSNNDFARFKAQVLADLAGGNSGGAGKATDDDIRRRLIWRIKYDASRAGLADEYIRSLAGDLTLLGDVWEDLDLPRLENLRNTINNRARVKIRDRSDDPF